MLWYLQRTFCSPRQNGGRGNEPATSNQQPASRWTNKPKSTPPPTFKLHCNEMRRETISHNQSTRYASGWERPVPNSGTFRRPALSTATQIGRWPSCMYILRGRRSFHAAPPPLLQRRASPTLLHRRSRFQRARGGSIEGGAEGGAAERRRGDQSTTTTATGAGSNGCMR